MYCLVERKVQSGKTSWQTLTASEQKIATEAKAMLTTAAKQGNAWAQYGLGRVFFNGEGVAKDYTEAMRWFQQAADKDMPMHTTTLV
jgi:TPR repeat protein